ncbi:MAG: NRDE family protein [bacterium]|nr:NRDE family protein [bacterium]
MCTVTVRQRSGHLLVTMNRDEYVGRAGERLPAIQPTRPEGEGWVAPRDGAGGGTWIAVNTQGVAACLLNHYEDGIQEGEARQRPSRGTIIPELMEQGSFDSAREWLRCRFHYRDYEPFVLGVFGVDLGLICTWRGSGDLEESPAPDPWTMLTSSSWNTEAVSDWRRAAFDEWRGDGCPFQYQVPSIHLHCPQGQEAWAPFMVRKDACTRSITQVAVDAATREVGLRYWPRPARELQSSLAEFVLPMTKAGSHAAW